MIRSSRTILATGLALAIGVSGVAIGGETGADNQVSTVEGKVSPKKLDKKKFKSVSLTNGVTTLNEDEAADGTVPEQETVEVNLDYDRDIKFNLTKAKECDVPAAALAGTTNEGAEDSCGPGSKISKKGDAAARFSGFPDPPFTNNEVNDFIVTAFRGEGNQVILHAYSPTFGPNATQIVLGNVVDSPKNGFRDRLAVPDVPPVAGGEGALVRFFATINKGDVITARCGKGKEFNFRAEFTYADGSGDVAKDSQGCQVKR